MSYKTAEEAIAAAMPEDGDFVGFAGHNCDDPCEGWDGVSRRCQCGVLMKIKTALLPMLKRTKGGTQ